MSAAALSTIADALDRVTTPEIDSLNAFLAVDGEYARRAASVVDERQKAGETLPLAGVPVAVKDNISVAGHKTTCASRLLETYTAPYDATAIARLKDAGAVVVGKTNLDEYAMGSSTENSAFGPTLNPHDRSRVAGGSSGGSAAAVASGCVPMALGSSTGGSVRQPAAFCGVVGLKPTYGRISRYGLVAFGSSLDQIGTLGASVSDAARLFAAVAGPDERDATTRPEPLESIGDLDTWDPSGCRIGWPKEYFTSALDPEIRDACVGARDRLKEAGAEIVDVSLPHSEYAIAVYYIVAIAEASSNLARYDGVRYGVRADADDLDTMYRRTRARFGAEVKRRVMLGTYVLSSGYYEAYYARGVAVRRKLASDFDAAWTQVDALLSPTTPTTAFEIGSKIEDPLAMYLNDIYTVSANLVGVPAISIPFGEAGGLPIGVQFMGPALSERKLLAMARFLERQAPQT